jgi:hypothetical protein
MRTSLGTAAILVTAAASGWFVRGSVGRTIAAQEGERPRPAIVAASLEDSFAPERVRFPSQVPQESLGTRNLFAYREPAKPPVMTITPPIVAQPVVETRPPITVAAPAPEPPRFAYRFIGTFGPENDRIAAFSRDGQITTVRAGEKIGDEFVLHSIGIESVEVKSARDRQSRQISLADSQR